MIVLVRAQIPATVAAAVVRQIRRVRPTRSASRVIEAILMSHRGGRNMTATAGIPTHTTTYISSQHLGKHLMGFTHRKLGSATAALFPISLKTIARCPLNLVRYMKLLRLIPESRQKSGSHQTC